VPTLELIPTFVVPLKKADVPYIITGSMAAMFFGEPRMTTDIDIIIDISPHNASKLVELFPAPEFYCPPEDIIRSELKRPIRGHLNVLHSTSSLKADFYTAGEDPLHAWAFKKRQEHEFSGERVFLAPPEFVIIRKLQYFNEGGSEKHLRDIRYMLKESPDINLDEVKRRAQVLGLTRAWKKVAPAE